MAKAQTKTIAENRKARHDYFIEETIEAGLELVGTEVKSCRLGKVNLRDSYAAVEDGQVFLYNVHISPYERGTAWNHEPTRKRRLLLHKHQIHKLGSEVRERGYTLVPLSLYFNERGRVKVALAVAKGKKAYDKRQSIAKRDAQRAIERAVREQA